MCSCVLVILTFGSFCFFLAASHIGSYQSRNLIYIRYELCNVLSIGNEIEFHQELGFGDGSREVHGLKNLTIESELSLPTHC